MRQVVETCSVQFGPVLGARDDVEAVSWNGDGKGMVLVLRAMSGKSGKSEGKLTWAARSMSMRRPRIRNFHDSGMPLLKVYRRRHDMRSSTADSV
jgi:hypothetical protein